MTKTASKTAQSATNGASQGTTGGKTDGMAADMGVDAGRAMMKMMETCMDMGAEMIAFGAKRLEKDVQFQHQLVHAAPKDLFHVQMQFWQGVLDDYHEESGKLVEMARDAGMPKL